MANAAEFTDSNFEEQVLKSDRPVLVDFWATWCGPCRQIAPIIEELASDNADSVKVGKVDVDHNREVAMRYGIQSIPTIMLFKDGEVVDRVLGVQSKNRLQEMINAHSA